MQQHQHPDPQAWVSSSMAATTMMASLVMSYKAIDRNKQTTSNDNARRIKNNIMSFDCTF
jgi:hypothetical protein